MTKYVLVDQSTKKYVTMLWHTYQTNEPHYRLCENIKYAETFSQYMQNKTSLQYIKNEYGLECFWHQLNKEESKIIFKQHCKEKADKYQTLFDNL